MTDTLKSPPVCLHCIELQTAIDKANPLAVAIKPVVDQLRFDYRNVEIGYETAHKIVRTFDAYAVAIVDTTIREALR